MTRRVMILMAAASVLAGVDSPLRAAESDAASSPRQLYNDGTRKLQEGKLPEAEACLQSAVASQDERVQPPALFNLGEVRYRQGAEDLKKGPQEKRAAAAARQSFGNAGMAIQVADQALAGDDMKALISAYQQGRGARKDLTGATEAVKSAVESFGDVLAKWQRASGDFKSAHELVPTDLESKTNAAIVDHSIAWLVDQQQAMMMAMQSLGKQRQELGKKLAELKKRIHQDDGSNPGGKKGDDDDDDDDKPPKGPKEGQTEPGTKSGTEMLLTREEAARLLDMLKLDGNRKLAYGTTETGKPKDRNGRDW